MKNIKILAGIFLILTAFTFTSCTTEPIDSAIDLDDFGNPSSGPIVFKADFSGDTWNGTLAQAIVGGNYITISGAKANGEGFAFYIEANTTGTFPAKTNLLSYTPAGSEFSYESINFNNPEEDTGSITITNINTTNHTVSGTFNFKGYWSDLDNTAILPVQFTNGVFTNIPFITQAETGDTFFAKVGGTEFVDVDILATTTTVATQEWISVSADDAAANSMTVSVLSSVGPGTYSITGNVAVDQAQASYSLASIDYSSISGSVTIISKTATHIKGTFNFIGSDGTTSKTITDGAFDVEY